MQEIIDYCNANSGFISAVLAVVTILLSVIAIVVSIKAAMLPFTQKIKLYPAVSEDEYGRPCVEMTLLNIGNCPAYVEDIVLTQKIMHPLALGYLRGNVKRETRILSPGMPWTYHIPMQNYNDTKYNHKKHDFLITVETTKRKYKCRYGWDRC